MAAPMAQRLIEYYYQLGHVAFETVHPGIDAT
jgi:hypothetical protein